MHGQVSTFGVTNQSVRGYLLVSETKGKDGQSLLSRCLSSSRLRTLVGYVVFIGTLRKKGRRLCIGLRIVRNGLG